MAGRDEATLKAKIFPTAMKAIRPVEIAGPGSQLMM
jgi:hypothetical protein